MPNDKDFELDDLESFSFDDLPPEEAEATNDAASGEDPFGVWVKSAPEEVEAGLEEGEVPDAALPDFDDLPPSKEPASLQDSDSLPEEDFLSSDELASLDDSFEFVTVDEPASETVEPLEDEIAFLDAPESRRAEAAEESSFDEISLDDFVSFDSPDDRFAPVASSPVVTTDEGIGEEEPEEEFLDIDIDIEDDIGDEELEIIEGALPKASDDLELVETSFDSEEVDLSEFGEFDASSDAPEELSSPAATAESSLPDLADFETDLDTGLDFETATLPTAQTDHDALPDFESLPALDLDIPFGDSDDNSEFEEILLDEGDHGVLAPNPSELEPQDETDLDQLKALEEDLTSGIRHSAETPAAPVQDAAATILSKIEQELSSIKQEIFALKHEVTNLRSVPASPIPETAVFAPPAGQTPEGPSKGFFDEEDDETIALTGDELDNILSTAEISEENEAGESLDDDLLATDAEGNLVTGSFSDEGNPDEESSEFLDEASPESEWQNGPVTDEEFLSGTSLELDDTPAASSLEDNLGDELASLGIPESIELEDDLPVALDSDETENLLESSDHSFMAEGMSEDFETLTIPDDDELAEEVGLAMDPEPVEDAPVPESSELTNETVEDLVEDEAVKEEFSPEREGDLEGWSPPSAEAEPQKTPESPVGEGKGSEIPKNLKDELRAVLAYMDKLLSSLPDDKIQEFAESEHFEVYKKLFEELGLID